MPCIFGESFEFAAPPKCGCTWAIAAFDAAGLPCERKGWTKVHLIGYSGKLPSITFVREPSDWIRSYYQNMRNKVAHVSMVDMFQSLYSEGDSFDSFIENYLKSAPGSVGSVFKLYRADFNVTLNDLTWKNLSQTLDSIGVEHKQGALMDMEPRNVTKSRVEWNKDLLQEFNKVL